MRVCAIRFRELSNLLKWDDATTIKTFYHGLKEQVKDELYQQPRPDDLEKYVEMAIAVDDRQYPRHQEKKNYDGPWTIRRQGKIEPAQHQGDPMDLDHVKKGRRRWTTRDK